MENNTYIVSLKRERRDSAPPGWQALLEQVQGLIVKGRTANRFQVEADEQALRDLKEKLGALCHIEPLKNRETL